MRIFGRRKRRKQEYNIKIELKWYYGKCVKVVRKSYEMAGCGVGKCAHCGSSLLRCDVFIICAQVDSECGT